MVELAVRTNLGWLNRALVLDDRGTTGIIQCQPCQSRAKLHYDIGQKEKEKGSRSRVGYSV